MTPLSNQDLDPVRNSRVPGPRSHPEQRSWQSGRLVGSGHPHLWNAGWVSVPHNAPFILKGPLGGALLQQSRWAISALNSDHDSSCLTIKLSCYTHICGNRTGIKLMIIKHSYNMNTCIIWLQSNTASLCESASEHRAVEEPVCMKQRNYSINCVAFIVLVWGIYLSCAYWALQSCDKLICEWGSLLQWRWSV